MNKERKLILFAIVSIALILYVKIYDKEFARAVRERTKYNSISMLNPKERPEIGLIKKKDIEKIVSISVDLNEYKIEDLRDLKKFKRLERLFLGYKSAKMGENRRERPIHLESIQSLNHLDNLKLFGVNLDGGFYMNQNSITSLYLDNCAIEDASLLTQFPKVESMTIRACNINSFDFLKEMDYLESLQLKYNKYNCSLQQLTSLSNLTELWIFSNTPDIFEQLPPISSVKELHLEGDSLPTRKEAERYFGWDSLNEMWVGGDKYDVATGIWSTSKN